MSPILVQRWLTAHKVKYGARRRVEVAHAVLRSALAGAQTLQLVSTNAAMFAKVPTRKRRSMIVFDVEQAAAFLKAADQHRLGALFKVAVACGLRLGEATGLQWNDVDLTTGEVHIRQ
jgi:integrase